MQTLRWTLRVHTFPRLIRRCTRCGGSFYETSGRFRVNANGKRLDVWLVCRCEACKAIWNLPVLTRIGRAALDPQDLRGYWDNDPAFALRYVFDPVFLARNHTSLDPGTLEFTRQGELPAAGDDAQIEVSCAYPLPLSCDRIAARCLGLSRSQIRRLAALNLLAFTETARRPKAETHFTFRLAADWQNTVDPH